MIATQDHLHVTCVNYLGCMTTPFSEEILVIEYCEQGTLAEYMQTEHFKRMSLTERTAAIILPLVNIVASLSHNPMIQFAHRDLTLRNILLTANMRLKLSDFGCAAIIKDGKVTMPGSAGMIDTWPPKTSSKAYEVSEAAQILIAADAFALGLILKETLGLKLHAYPESLCSGLGLARAHAPSALKNMESGSWRRLNLKVHSDKYGPRYFASTP